MLTGATVLIHSSFSSSTGFASSNIGHMVWDDFLPWFLVTRNFGLGEAAGQALRVTAF